MNYSNRALILTTCMLMLLSCSKTETPPDPVPDNGKVVGNWTIINITASTYETESSTNMTFTDSTRAVKVYDFVSFDNLGDMTIDDSAMSIKKLSYRYNDNYKLYNYHNGIFQDSSIVPSQTFVFEKSYTFPYKMINADSMYLEQGFVIYPDSLYVSSPAKGAKVLRVADTLYVTTKEEVSSTGTIRDNRNITSYSSRIQTIKYMKKL
jgi:hypothetical protein